METPEGYPYLKLTCITERPQWLKEEDREDTYYEAHPIVINFEYTTPIFWHRYKVRNPDTGVLELCIVVTFIDAVGNGFDLMIAETFPKFDKIIRDWIEYKNSVPNDTPDNRTT